MKLSLKVTCSHCGHDVFTPSQHFLYGARCEKCGTICHLAQDKEGELYMYPDRICNAHQEAKKADVRDTEHYPRVVRDDDPAREERDYHDGNY